MANSFGGTIVIGIFVLVCALLLSSMSSTQKVKTDSKDLKKEPTPKLPAEPCEKEPNLVVQVPDTSNKIKWPELVGVDGKEAKAKIEKERPDLKLVATIPSGYMVTADYRPDRVRIYLDEDGKVARAPQTG
mmetsp:Transcript_6980/g.10647  ORF Transcript_6980/g.10647 Transcript_6980/m.10647 type:complete len:131 (+) Transcript_6980:80-472(+)